jgi:protein-tyrosine-phosphatase
MPDRVHNVLFLCIHNSAPSIMAEALLNHVGEGRFRAFSAGSEGGPGPKPMALKVLEAKGVPTGGPVVEDLGRVRKARRARHGSHDHGL